MADGFELREENDALHEQLAKAVDRIMELEAEVAHYKQWWWRIKDLWQKQTQTRNILKI